MTLEFILWVVAWVVLSEVAFIISYFKYGKDSLYHWVFFKFMSFLCVGCFMMIQFVIVFWGMEGDSEMILHYIRLLYEAIVIAVIVGLFFCNWLITKKIDECKNKKSKKRKKL